MVLLLQRTLTVVVLEAKVFRGKKCNEGALSSRAIVLQFGYVLYMKLPTCVREKKKKARQNETSKMENKNMAEELLSDFSNQMQFKRATIQSLE